MKALDYMIDNNLWEYHCDPWYSEPGASNYASVRAIRGQVAHRGFIFVVHHANGSRGMGGMDEGSPPSVAITRVRMPRTDARVVGDKQ